MNEESSRVEIEPSPLPHPARASRDGFVDFLYPNPGPFFLRFHTEGLASSTDTFLQRRQDRWREVGNWGLKDAPTLDDLAIAAKWGRPRLGLCLTRASVESEIAPLMLAWVAWNIPILEPATHPFLHAYKRAIAPGSAPSTPQVSRIDPDAKQRVLDLISSIEPLPPHVVVDEGERVIGLWKLAEPLVEPFAESFHWAKMRSTRLLHSLAIQLGADARFADSPHQAVIDLPGSKREDLPLYPPPVVTATINEAEPVSIEQLELYAADGMTQAIRSSRGRAS